MAWDRNAARIERLEDRIERVERERREEKDRRFERWGKVLVSIAWLEVIAIWAFSIARAAGG